jgi:hypothetical protein
LSVRLIIARWPELHLQAAPVSLFLCASMFSAWFGGARPGLLATALSVLAFYWYFLASAVGLPFNNINLALLKGLALGERYRMQFRAEWHGALAWRDGVCEHQSTVRLRRPFSLSLVESEKPVVTIRQSSCRDRNSLPRGLSPSPVIGVRHG